MAGGQRVTAGPGAGRQPLTAAERQRRSRARRKYGLVTVTIDTASDARAALVRLGWLAVADRDKPEAVTAALIRLASAAIARAVTP